MKNMPVGSQSVHNLPATVSLFHEACQRETAHVLRGRFLIEVHLGSDLPQGTVGPSRNELQYLDAAVIGDTFKISLKIFRALYFSP